MYQYYNKKSGSLIVKKQTYKKQKSIAKKRLVAHQGKQGENQGEKRPKVKLSEKKRTFVIKRKHIGKKYPEIFEIHNGLSECIFF